MTKAKKSKDQFFVVFSPDGETPPKVVHDTHPGALWAAYRLAKQHPESTFYVMGSMSRPCTAQGIEAQRAETPQGGSVACDESPVGNADAPQTSSKTHADPTQERKG